MLEKTPLILPAAGQTVASESTSTLAPAVAPAVSLVKSDAFSTTFVDVLSDLNILEQDSIGLDRKPSLDVEMPVMPVQISATGEDLPDGGNTLPFVDLTKNNDFFLRPLTQLNSEDTGLASQPSESEQPSIVDTVMTSANPAVAYQPTKGAAIKQPNVEPGQTQRLHPGLSAHLSSSGQLSQERSAEPDTLFTKQATEAVIAVSQQQLDKEIPVNVRPSANAVAINALASVSTSTATTTAVQETSLLSFSNGAFSTQLQPSSPSVTNVAQTTLISTPVTEAGWGNELSERVAWMVQKNVQVAEIKVNPPQLGPVEVRVSVNHDQASVMLAAGHATTREALEASIPRLREMLADAGLNLSDANVSSQSSDDQRGRGQFGATMEDESLDRQEDVNADDARKSGVINVSPGEGMLDLFA